MEFDMEALRVADKFLVIRAVIDDIDDSLERYKTEEGLVADCGLEYAALIDALNAYEKYRKDVLAWNYEKEED